jgi:PAS domain S-box-containing protein
MYWNAGAERTYGWTAEEASGQVIQDLLHTRPVSTSLEELLASLSRDSIWAGELEKETQDGRTILVASRQTVRRNLDGSTASILVIERDVTERKLLENERATATLHAQRQAERDRIAMDLHDGAIQSIYAVTLNLETIGEEAGDDETRTSVDRSIESLQRVIADIRSYIFQLRRPDLTGDIVGALEELAANAESAGGLAVSVNVTGEVGSIQEVTSESLYHVVQEALMNAVRHSGASRVRVDLSQGDGRTAVVIEDDGNGFDTDLVHDDSHNGLRNLAARAEKIGGSVRIRSSPGAGTSITLELPS